MDLEEIKGLTGFPDKKKMHGFKRKGRIRKNRFLFIICLIIFCFPLAACNLSRTGQKGVAPAEQTVSVKGIEKEYTILFLTDTHIVVPSDTDSEEEKQYGEERIGMFVSAEGVPSKEVLPEWISYANEKKVDAFLLGGDIIDSPTEGNIKYLKDNLDQLEVPYLFVPGNHDWTFPWNYMTEEGKQEYLPRLPVKDGNADFQVMDMGELLVVGINDSTNQVAPEAVSGFEQVIKEGRPVIVLTHVPFMTQSLLARAREEWSSPVVLGAGNFGGIYPDGNSEKIMDQIAAKDSPVELVLAGHVHFENDDVIEGEKDVRQIVGDDGYSGTGILIKIRPE